MLAFIEDRKEIIDFFRNENIFNSTLAIMYTILILIFPIVGYIAIIKNREVLDKKEVI